MPQNPYILTGVDVRRISTGESRVRLLNYFTAPSIKNKTINHAHGGGNGNVEFVLPTLEAFQPSFETMGPDLDSLAAVGLVTGTTDTWVFAGAFLVRGATTPIASRIIINGTIAEVDDGQHSAGGNDKQNVKHMIKGVTHYERHIDGKEWMFWDFDSMEFRVNGVDIMAGYRSALGV